MKTIAKIALLFFITSAALAQDKTFTLWITNAKMTNEFAVKPGETLELITFFDAKTPFGTSEAYLKIQDPTGGTVTVPLDSGNLRTLKVNGPASVIFSRYNTHAPRDPGVDLFATFKITPEQFDPNKTVVIPADTKGAKIIVESSKDLIAWEPAEPGTYTNLTAHTFFRIRAERLPE